MSSIRRLVRLSLAAYPRRDRERYREEIVEVVLERVSAARARSGPAGGSGMLLRELAGIVLSGATRRRRARRRRAVPRKVETMSFFHDLAIAARGLRRRPAFTVAAAAALALAIGASIAIFTVFHAVVLRPLPFSDPDRLVALWEKNPGRDWYQVQVAPANYLDWRAEARSFSDMAGYYDCVEERIVLEGDGPPSSRSSSGRPSPRASFPRAGPRAWTRSRPFGSSETRIMDPSPKREGSMLSATFVLAALVVSDLEVGTRIRVSTRGEEMTGVVEEVQDTALRIRLEEGLHSRSIPFSEVEKLEVSRGLRSRCSGAWSKARWVALFGATTGAISLGLQHEQVGEGGSSPGEAAALGAWSGGLFGGLIGAVLGALDPGESWERVTPSFQLGRKSGESRLSFALTIAF